MLHRGHTVCQAQGAAPLHQMLAAHSTTSTSTLFILTFLLQLIIDNYWQTPG